MPFQPCPAPADKETFAPSKQLFPVPRKDSQDFARLVYLHWSETKIYAFPNALLDIG